MFVETATANRTQHETSQIYFDNPKYTSMTFKDFVTCRSLAQGSCGTRRDNWFSPGISQPRTKPFVAVFCWLRLQSYQPHIYTYLISPWNVPLNKLNHVSPHVHPWNAQYLPIISPLKSACLVVNLIPRRDPPALLSGFSHMQEGLLECLQNPHALSPKHSMIQWANGIPSWIEYIVQYMYICIYIYIN